jgi:DNA-binding CsgD family transcriptional regulator
VDRLPLPATYDAVVQRRLALLDASAREVMTAAAIVGADAPSALLAAIAGRDADTVRAALRSGVEANLLTAVRQESNGLSFRHALVADSILARLLPDERRDVLLRSAVAAEAEFPGLPGEWCVRVADLRERGSDPDEAFRLLMEAGRRALRRGALLTAEATLDRAGRLAGVDRWRHMGVGRVLARVLASTGNVARLRQLASATLEVMEGKHDSMGTPGRLGELHLQIARGLVAARDWASADAQLRTVERMANAAGDDHLRCTMQAINATVAFELGQHRRATSLASAAEANSARVGSPEAVVTAYRVRARLALLGGDVDGATALLARADQLARHDTALVLERVETLVTLAGLDEATSAALDHVLTAADVAATTEAPLSQVLVEVQRARLHLARFELAEARAAADRASEASRRYRLPTLAAAVRISGEIAALQGDGQRAHASIREAQLLGGSTPDLQLARCAVEVTLALRRGDVRRARMSLDRLDVALVRDDTHPHAWYGGIRALLATLGGAPPPAASGQPGTPATVAAAFRLLAASIAQIRDDPEAAEAGVTRADAFLAPFPWRRHVGRLLTGDAVAAAGWESLSTWLGQAAEQAKVAAACRGVLRRAGAHVGRRGRGSAPVPPPLRQTGITNREMDVLLLVSDGLSNAEIAERLHLSVRTVETHVSSAMRKTASPNRSRLAALVVTMGSAESSADNSA